MTAPDVFRRVVQALDAAGIPYMLTGSFASAYHAVPRATQDIDLVIAPDRDQLGELVRAFSAPSYDCDAGAALEALEEESLFNVIDLATGWKIDFIIASPASTASPSSPAGSPSRSRAWISTSRPQRTYCSASSSGRSSASRNVSSRTRRGCSVANVTASTGRT